MTAQIDAEAGAPADTPPAAPGPSVRWPVFITSFAGVCLVTLWAVVAPTNAEKVIGELVSRVGTGFGWFYVALATVVVGFVVFLGASRYGNIRLGPDHARPEFSTFAWASMLFAAGIGTDVMFYSVIEPVSHYTAPPVGEPGTVDAARDATVWTLFHYGVTGWAMYALMGLALATSPTARTSRSPCARRSTRSSASASTARSATPSTPPPSSARSSASRPASASAWCSSTSAST